jgi:hypothetical protein
MCDTAKTGLPCSFDVGVSVGSGSISNVAGESLGPSDQVLQSNPSEVHALTTTTTGLAAITFDAAAGNTIELDAQIDGQRSGSVLFFVQDGKINGGYTTPVTDPLNLMPSAP